MSLRFKNVVRALPVDDNVKEVMCKTRWHGWFSNNFSKSFLCADGILSENNKKVR
jgi:hypothetical protein